MFHSYRQLPSSKFYHHPSDAANVTVQLMSTMNISDAVRQVEEILNLQDRWFAKDGGVTVQTPALFSRLQKVTGSNGSNQKSNKRLEVKKQLAFDIDCSVLHPVDLEDMIIEVTFPLNYPSSAPCQVGVVKASNRELEYKKCLMRLRAKFDNSEGFIQI